MSSVDIADVARFVVVPLLAAIIGGFIVHRGARRRDLENDRRRQRVEYLVTAYRTLARAAHRGLQGERGEAFEDALSDIVLLGDKKQIHDTNLLIEEFGESGSVNIDRLLLSLRSALRDELALSGDSLSAIPAVRMIWGPSEPAAGENVVRVAATTSIEFDERLAATGRLVQRSRGDGVTMSEVSAADVAELYALADQAPGAAVVSAYSLVSGVIANLLREHDPGIVLGVSDAVELSRIAEERELVTTQQTRTIEGLQVLMTLSRSNGAGSGLSPEKARDYIDLAAATLYSLRA